MERTTYRLVFVDLETGGLDPQSHPIIQIAAVAVDRDLEPLEAFEAKLRFSEKKSDRNSLRKNHYHPGVWAREAKEVTEVAKEFSQFLRRHAAVPVVSGSGESYRVAQLVAHNAVFDAPFLEAWFDRVRMFLPARRQVLCTLQRAMWYFAEHGHEKPPPDYKLATLCKYFSVPFHAASAHEALGDVVAALGLYGALLMRAAPSRKKAA